MVDSDSNEGKRSFVRFRGFDCVMYDIDAAGVLSESRGTTASGKGDNSWMSSEVTVKSKERSASFGGLDRTS